MNPALALALAQGLSAIVDGIMKELLARNDIKQGVRDEATIFAKEQENKALTWRIAANADPAAHGLLDLGGRIVPPAAGPQSGADKGDGLQP